MCAEMGPTSTIKDELIQAATAQGEVEPRSYPEPTLLLPLPQGCTEPFYRPNTVLWAVQGSPFSRESEGHEPVPCSSWAIPESSSHQPDRSPLMTNGDTEFKGVCPYVGSTPLEKEGDSDTLQH